MARPIKTTSQNSNILEPYILATAKYHFTANEKRILYRLMEIAQKDIDKATNGEPIKKHLRPLFMSDTIFGDKYFSMYISDILDTCGEGNNYGRVKEAFKKLQTKLIVFEDDDVYKSTPFLHHLEIKKRTGYASFYVSKEFWAAILNFTKGFRKFELITAMKLKSPYSMRFYELISRQKTPLRYSVEQIRDMFALKDKYKQPASIRKRIIEPAKRELDEFAPYSFNLKEERRGNGKTSPITHFVFIPYCIEDNQDKDLQRIERLSKLTARNVFAESDIYEILRYQLDFDVRAVTVNKKTISEGREKIPDFCGFLSSLVDSKHRKEATNPIGYVIGSIKQKIKDIENDQSNAHT